MRLVALCLFLGALSLLVGAVVGQLFGLLARLLGWRPPSQPARLALVVLPTLLLAGLGYVGLVWLDASLGAVYFAAGHYTDGLPRLEAQPLDNVEIGGNYAREMPAELARRRLFLPPFRRACYSSEAAICRTADQIELQESCPLGTGGVLLLLLPGAAASLAMLWRYTRPPA